jgi:hypothetical protein
MNVIRRTPQMTREEFFDWAERAEGASPTRRRSRVSDTTKNRFEACHRLIRDLDGQQVLDADLERSRQLCQDRDTRFGPVAVFKL